MFNTGLSAYTSVYNRIVVYADYFMQGANRIAQGGFSYTRNFDPAGDDARLSLSGGAVYRWKDAFAPVVKINTNKLSIGLSYDDNTSKLRTAFQYRGGFELTLSYMGLWNSKNSNVEKIDCPVNIW